MNLSPVEDVMESIRGAVIVHGDCPEGDGLHLHLGDGRIVIVTVIRGCLALAILAAEKECLH